MTKTILPPLLQFRLVKRIISLLTLSILIYFVSLTSALGGFIHPGIYHDANDLAFMRQKIAEHAEPWSSAWKGLQSEYYAKATWAPHATAVWDANKHGYMDGDAVAAYSNALQWALTGDESHAQAAINILNAWSSSLQSIVGTVHQEQVVCGWNGCHLANAAELLVHGGIKGKTSGWKPEDIAKCKKMFDLFYDTIKDFQPGFNGNWDAAMMNTMMSIAIFCDDQAKFDRAVNHFYGKDQKPGQWGYLTAYIYPTGQCEETGRDQGHVQMGLGNYVSICEIGRHQGLDLYGAANNRLLLGLEYTVKFNLGNDDIPYQPGPVPSWKVPSAEMCGLFSGIYEAAYQHYVCRKGLKMPYTAELFSRKDIKHVGAKTAGEHRPEGGSLNSGICWGTLTMFRGNEANKK